MSDDANFDVIVIGSGIGGLTTAGILARVARLRVLVLESHFKLGGFTHSFRRKNYEWDAGVHYVGEMYDGAMARRVMDFITNHGVKWHRMGKTVERIMFPEGTFEYPDNFNDLQESLIRRFPHEESGIRKYFKDVKRAKGWLDRWYTSKALPWPFSWLLTLGSKSLAHRTTGDYLNQCISDPLLKAVLTAQWPDYGAAPGQSAFGIHATVTADFFNGGYFPIGGSQNISTQAAAVIEKHGGRCLVNHPVTEIICEGNRAVGVKVEHKGKTLVFRARNIISNAGATTTFDRLVPRDHCASEREKVRRLKRGVSATFLFLGLKDDPRKHGFDDANYWINNTMNADAPVVKRRGKRCDFAGVFLSFGSLRNPGQKHHTAQIITFSEITDWSDHDGTEWNRRGAEYEREKEIVADDLINFVEQRTPGLRDLIEFREVGTPLTVKSFTGHPGGMIYGQLCDPARLSTDQWPIRTSLKNLFLTGSDIGTPGVNGAMMAGVMTAARILGPLGLPRIFGRVFSKANAPA
ncbi:MAG: NAD(P)/FAD-dependent oxidoreductase [Planctomycetaceae bacterium]